MASLFSIPILPLIIFFLFITSTHSDSSTSLETPTLSSFEQESLYHILESIDSTFNWRLNYPDDLCYSGPRGVTCDYFTETNGVTSLHITELNFGYVSDYSSFPPCSSTSSFSPSLTSLTYLRKLFFYKCFTDVTTHVTLPGYFSNLSTSLEQLVFIENPALFGSLDGIISSFKNLKRLVFVGSNVTGEIPYGVGELSELEQVTLTRNEFYGKVPESLGKLKKLKVIDLSYNGFEGNVPDSFGEITELFKLDLSSNHFDGKIPDGLKKLQRLEYLDLSYNKFGNFGIPLFLGEMQSLKEVHLSGNFLGGQIPEIWEKLGGILGIGLSGVGLVGEIPSSMGMFLRNVSYLRLDNNRLEGIVPREFGLLESVLKELNLENNILTGRLPFSANFSAKMGRKLKLSGNNELCVNEVITKGSSQLCKKPVNPSAVLFSSGSSSTLSQFSSLFGFLFGVCFVLGF